MMNFGQALEELKKSLYNKTIPTVKVSRVGWNGKGMWISIVDPYNNKQFNLQEKDIEGTFVPWLASQTDVLAEDWDILS